jgi:tripartite-type tricarboxylate transporter receptor subunit TctC
VLTGLLANEVDFAIFTLGATLPHIRTGKVRPIAIGSDRRDAALPDVPPMREAVPGLTSASWFALLAPPKTPPAIVAKVHGGIVEGLRHSEAQRRLAELNAVPIGNTPDEAAAFIADEKARWGKVIRAANIKAE